MDIYTGLLKSYRMSFLLTGAMALWATAGFGQNYIDLLRIEYSGSPGNDFKSGSGSSDVREWAAEATVPVRLTAANTFLTGFLFERVNVSLYADQHPVSVNTINLKLGLNQTYSGAWSGSYLLLPKFSSDLKRYQRDDFQIGVAALLKYTKSKNLQFKFGAFYNTDLFGPFITPFLGLYFQREKWEANILLPRLVDLNYQIAPAFRLGLRFNGSIKSFHLNEDFNGIPQYLSNSNSELGAYIGWALGRINLVGFIGHSLGRNYRTYAQGDQVDLAISVIKLGDDRTQLNGDFKDGPVFKLAALYRLALDNR